MVGLEARIDERVFLRLRIEHRDLPQGPFQREEFGRRMIRTLLAVIRIVGPSYGCGQPGPALLIEHRIMVVDPRIPDVLVTPVCGGLQRRETGGMAGPQA